MDPGDRTIAVIAADETDLAYYLSRLGELDGIRAEGHPSLRVFRRRVLGRLFAGVVVDIPTLRHSTSDEREFFAQLLDVLPLLQVMRGREADALTGFAAGADLHNRKGPDLLRAFVYDLCWIAPPRGVRGADRIDIHLSAYAWYDVEPGSGPAERVMLGQMSGTGCFVITTTEQPVGHRLWLHLPELPDRGLIQAQVAWCQPWTETGRQLPGLGVSFLRCGDDQLAALLRILDG